MSDSPPERGSPPAGSQEGSPPQLRSESWLQRRSRRRALRRYVPAGLTTPEDVRAELDRAKALNAATDYNLRRVIGYGAPALMVVQIAIADYVFYVYGSANGWDIDSTAIDVWLAATVVQLAIIAHGIGRYLFPPEDRKGKGADRP